MTAGNQITRPAPDRGWKFAVRLSLIAAFIDALDIVYRWTWLIPVAVGLTVSALVFWVFRSEWLARRVARTRHPTAVIHALTYGAGAMILAGVFYFMFGGYTALGGVGFFAGISAFGYVNRRLRRSLMGGRQEG